MIRYSTLLLIKVLKVLNIDDEGLLQMQPFIFNRTPFDSMISLRNVQVL